LGNSIRTKRTALAAALLLSTLSTVACSGAGNAPLAIPAPRSSAGNGASTPATTLRFVWPAHPAPTTIRRRRAYVSPSIASLTIAIDSGAVTTETAPTPTGSPLTVTYAFSIAPGNHSLSIAEYDATNNLLGRATQPITIVGGVSNQIAFTLDGNLAQIAIVPTSDPFLEGSLASGFTLVGDRAQTFSAIPEDADGNRIITPGTIPPIATSSANSAIVDTDLGNDTFTLYAPAPTAFQTITASGTSLTGTAVTTSFQADALAAIYVANFTPQTIGVYDETGTAIPIAGTSFAGLQNPGGIAYVPATVPGNAGSLYITQTADSSTVPVVKFDTAGNPQTLASTAFPGTAEPLFAGYGLFGSTPAIAIPNENSSSIGIYDLSGNPMTPATGSFSKLDVPVQVLYDAHDADYYATNLGSATINQYSSTGTPIVTGVNAGNATMGETLDTDNDEIYCVFQDQALPGETIGGKEVTVGSQLAMVEAFTEALSPVSLSSTAFVPPTTTAFYAAIAFDPNLKEFFITDAGDNTMVAFTESGTSVTLPSGAFGNLSDPMGIAIVP
jgi:hypothetical protein